MAGPYHIESRLKGKPDIIRTYNWEITIPRIGEVSESLKDVEELVCRARSTSIPSRGHGKIESNFGAMKQFFPGKPVFTNTIQVTFEDTEDQILSLGLYEWANRIFDVRPNVPTGGTSLAEKKREVALDMILTLQDNNREALKKRYKLVNCFIENIDEVALDYADENSVKIPVTFSYDFWYFI